MYDLIDKNDQKLFFNRINLLDYSILVSHIIFLNVKNIEI